MRTKSISGCAFLGSLAIACSSSTSNDPPGAIDLGDASASFEADAADAGEAVRVIDDHFVMDVVSFTPGPCAGFGQDKMPDIVKGAPKGGGGQRGSLDVLSLGVGGEIVVSFGQNAIVDGAGIDFLVFENVFFAQGDETKPNAEVGEVSVSDDGTTWKSFPCAGAPPYDTCAGWHPTYASWDNGISPRDPVVAGERGSISRRLGSQKRASYVFATSAARHAKTA